MRLLFICSMNAMRSPTAEAVFSQVTGIDALSAGTEAKADMPISVDLIEWADVILVMEGHHRKKLKDRFGKMLATKKLVVLDIPDLYRFGSPNLVKELKAKVPKHLQMTAEQMMELESVVVV